MKEGRIETLDRTLSTRRVENATRVVEKFMTPCCTRRRAKGRLLVERQARTKRPGFSIYAK